MKILEIFENKLRYKNYSQNTIKTYKQTLYQYFKETNCKDPYRISTKEIVNYLETKSFTYSNSRKPCSLDPLGQGVVKKIKIIKNESNTKH